MNLLFLSHRVPHPPNRGDRIRSYNILKYIARFANVRLACLADEPPTAETRDVLSELCDDVAIRDVNMSRWVKGSLSLLSGRSITEGMFAHRGLHRDIAKWNAEVRFDATFVYCSSMLQYVRGPLAATPCIVDLIDVDSQKWLDYAGRTSGLKRMLFSMEGNRVRRLETNLPQNVKRVLLTTEAETKLFRSVSNLAERGPQVNALTNGVDSEFYRPKTGPNGSPCKLVFVGVLDYPPNVQGLKWFCENVLPSLKKSLPVQLQVVGRRPVATVMQLGAVDEVEVVGEVPDVRPYLQGCHLAIAPLQVARGVQNKVLEAMAMGKTVVATSAALEGIETENLVHTIRADDPTDWVNVIAKLHRDLPMRTKIECAARQFVEQHHSWDACLAPLRDYLQEFACPT